MSSCSSKLNSDKREYNQEHPLNISHSERCLNKDYVSVVPFSVILVIKHLCFTYITAVAIRALDFTINMVSLVIRNFTVNFTTK